MAPQVVANMFLYDFHGVATVNVLNTIGAEKRKRLFEQVSAVVHPICVKHRFRVSELRERQPFVAADENARRNIDWEGKGYTHGKHVWGLNSALRDGSFLIELVLEDDFGQSINFMTDLLDTMCHELAHCRYRKHDADFHALHAKLKEELRVKMEAQCVAAFPNAVPAFNPARSPAGTVYVVPQLRAIGGGWTPTRDKLQALIADKAMQATQFDPFKATINGQPIKPAGSGDPTLSLHRTGSRRGSTSSAPRPAGGTTGHWRIRRPPKADTRLNEVCEHVFALVCVGVVIYAAAAAVNWIATALGL